MWVHEQHYAESQGLYKCKALDYFIEVTQSEWVQGTLHSFGTHNVCTAQSFSGGPTGVSSYEYEYESFGLVSRRVNRVHGTFILFDNGINMPFEDVHSLEAPFYQFM